MKNLTLKLVIIGFSIIFLLSFTYNNTLNTNQKKAMKIAVWDTYVKKQDGIIMHFDILVPDTMKDAKVVYGFGKHYLDSKRIISDSLTAKECRFCHIEQATDEMIKDIEAKGYSIIEMENCN